MRLIDADALKKAIEEFPNCYNGWSDAYDKSFIIGAIEEQPSIGIVRCKECKWLRYCETEDLDLYLDCDCPNGGGIPRNEEWFCADGERRE